MADNGGRSRGGGRGGRGGGSARGGSARSRRGRGGSSRQQGGPTASAGSGRGGGGGNNTPVYRAIGDETTDKIGREVSELVMSSRPNDCSKLEALLAQTHKQHPKRLQTVLHRNTTFSFPQGHMLAAACSNGKVAAADLLLRYGVEPNKQCPSGSTALSLACYNGKTACVKLLLGLPGSLRGPAVAGVGVPSRASPRVAPAYGANAMIHACRCTNEKAAEEIVGALLEADPSLPLEAAEGALALHAAAASGFPRVLERLLKSNDQSPGDQCETQLGWINNDNLCALQVAEKKCETEMQREREKQAQASRAPRPQGGGGGQQQQQQQQRRGTNNGGGSRGGRGRRNGARGRGGGGSSSAGRGGGDGDGGGGQSEGGSIDGAASEGGESRDGRGDGDSAGPPRRSPPGVPAGWQKGEVLEGGWGCVVVLVRASGNGIRNALHGSLSLKTDVVRDRLLSFLGLNALVKDIRKQRDEVEKAGRRADVADDFSDYTMSVLTHVSAMYKAVLKLPRSALQGPQQSTTSRLLVELIRPRDGLPRAVDDISCLVLLEILVNSTANPQVVRPLVLLLTEMANAPLPRGFSVDAGSASMIESSLPEWDSRAVPCCVLHRKEPTVPRNGPGFHFQACLDVWQNVCACIARLGRMLLYGLQGQQEGEHGEVLYEREGLLFDSLWELVFRFLVPHADEVACFLADHNVDKGNSPTSSILKVAGSAFPSLWTGLSEALSVVEGDVGGTEPDRFGALLRGYLAYLHLADGSEEHYKAIVKVVKENGVDTGLASSAAGGGGGGGVRRGGRGQSAGRNPRNILTAIAAETELGIPEAFRELVVDQSDAVEEILDADPAVLENRLSVLLRIEGAVETPQKLDYIASALEARAGRSGKGLELCVNRMAEPHEVVEVTMQQLAAAPPRAMAPHPELKFVNEQGQGDGPMRELLDLLSEVFRPERTIAVTGGGTRSASDASASATTASGPSPGGGASGGGAAGGRSTGRSTLNPAAAVFVKPGPGGAGAGASGSSSLPSPPVSADMARLEAAFSASAPDDYEVPRSGGGGNDGGSGRRSGIGAGGPTTALPPAAPGETSTQTREEETRDRSRKVAEVAGFWKQFPLFRRYEPEPAAVVPRAAGEAGVNSANDREGMESRLRFFRAAGRIIAMSVMSGSPLGVVMPEAVWSVLLGSTPTWEECCGRDTQYLESMRKVLAHEFGKGEGGNGMELYFSVSERGVDGKVTDVPLLAGGENKRVTDKNKQEFVNLATRRRALGGAEKAVAALRSGMTDVIPKNLLSILLPPEAASIVSGPQGEVNLSELRTNVWYVESDAGFGCSHKSVRWFWEWANELTESDRRKLLLFWSGSSRVPPFGFEDDALNEDHRWAIDKGPAANACPTASTCDRRMSLPQYSSKEAAFKFLTITLELGCLGYTTV